MNSVTAMSCLFVRTHKIKLIRVNVNPIRDKTEVKIFKRVLGVVREPYPSCVDTDIDLIICARYNHILLPFEMQSPHSKTFQTM